MPRLVEAIWKRPQAERKTDGGDDDAAKMARAMKPALESGRLSYRAGRIPKKRYATASSPLEGVISYIPGE